MNNTEKLYMAYNHNGTELLPHPMPYIQARNEAFFYSRQTENESFLEEVE